MLQRCVYTLLAACGLAALLLPVPARAADIPAVSDAELAQALELAGSNRAELERVLQQYAQEPFKRSALRFLLVSLPVVDLGVISAAELTENVDLAVQARDEFAYARHYDDATWAHYVLPPRVSQEPLSPWRRLFYDALREQVADCQTIGEAATIASAYYGTLATYKPTQSRDQSPLATIKGGYGRCEELVILFIDCCRAVGIPARQAYCPYWAAGDDNHAWWEVLGSDGRWHLDVDYGPGENREANWVVHSARQAPLVVSVCFGLPGPQEQGLNILSSKADVGARYCHLNSVADYRMSAQLSVYAGAAAAPDPQTGKPRKLVIHVFNYGALRQVARVEFDTAGSASVQLGLGDYFITSDLPDGPRTALIHLRGDQIVNWALLPPAPAEMTLFFPKDK